VSKKTSGISVFALSMLIVGSIDSMRNLPSTALFGSSLVFFVVLAAITFLIPCALVSAELSSAFTERGGIYSWVKAAFGTRAAFFAIWLQWINTMIWFPTILSFIAGSFAYLFFPELANSKFYLIGVILAVFWLNTFITLFGIELSTKFTSFCATFGVILPIILIIGLGLYWMASGQAMQIDLKPISLVPHLDNFDSWLSLTAIIASFLGIELACVNARFVKNPKKNFPKAITISTIIIIVTMILGSLSIAIVIPHHKINLISGVIQAFAEFFRQDHFEWFLPELTILIILGSIGGMINWIISPSRGLLLSAEDGHLPKFFARHNKKNMPVVLLITQAIIVSFVSTIFLFQPSVNGSYWFLTALSTELYVGMYIFMFISAIALRYKQPERPRPFHLPGKTWGMWIVVVIGILGCMTTIVVGFFPPNEINVGNHLHYILLFAISLIVICTPPFLIDFVRKIKK
jgi:amino acid transporter